MRAWSCEACGLDVVASHGLVVGVVSSDAVAVGFGVVAAPLLVDAPQRSRGGVFGVFVSGVALNWDACCAGFLQWCY